MTSDFLLGVIIGALVCGILAVLVDSAERWKDQ